MKKFECGDSIVLKSDENREILAIHGSAEIVLREGAIGTVVDVYQNPIRGTIEDLKIEFSIFNGISIRIRISPEYVQHASSDQIDTHNYYNH